MIAEDLLLNKILETSDYSIISSNNITEDYFFTSKSEFNFIRNHYQKYGVVPDINSFARVFPQFKLSEIKEPLSYLLEEFFKEYKENFLSVQFNTIKKLVENQQLDKALESYKTSFEKISKQGVALEGINIFEDTSRFERYEERITGRGDSYVSTGFKELDQLIGGIDRENENMVIAARTGIGKTMILTKIAESVAKAGLKVGFYEGEMTVDKLAHRVDTMKSGISNIAINRGDPFIHNQYKSYIDSLKAVNEQFIVLTPDKIAGAPTVDVLSAFVDKYNLDILFVDQYSLLEDTGHSYKENERVANISKAIKMLQVKKKIPIISVSQNNRTKNDDGTHDTTQIALSDRIGQDATTILMLDKKDGVLDIDIVKARDGGDGHKLQYNINFNTGTFTYIPREGDGVTTDEALEQLASSYDVAEENPF